TECTPRGLPRIMPDVDAVLLDPDDIERIGFAARARGGRRSGLNDDGLVVLIQVTDCGASHVGHMKMTREQQIAFADGQHFERKLAAPDQAAGFMPGRKVERMVSDYDLDD